MRRLVLAVSLLTVTGCTPRAGLSPTPPPDLLGAFVDDYGSTFTITPETWAQEPASRARIVRWSGQTLIAQNDAANAPAYAPGRWTRIDWVRLDGMAPYTWAFCLTAYDAPTQAAAEATPAADRTAPRTGCNGYPFTRMRRR